MIKYIIDVFAMVSICVLLSVMGYPYYTWQYWIMIILILCYRFNGLNWGDLK